MRRGSSSSEELWDLFVTPPAEARPRAWWHWMDGNIDPAGIDRDLRWLHQVGIGGVQIFDGGMGGPLVVPTAVRPGSESWTEAVDTAVRTASELRMEVAVATSGGWSAAGAPWVRPEDAMKKVVWSETTVAGGSEVMVVLPELPTVAGLYQDSVRWGTPPSHAMAQEWVVLAFPSHPANCVLTPSDIRGSAPLGDWSCLIDDSFLHTLSLPRDPDGWSTAWLEQEFTQTVTVSSVTVGLPGPRGFGAAPAASGVLQVSDDGVRYRDVASLPPSSVPSRTVSFPPVTGTRFRLVLSAESAAAALPPAVDGMRLPPVLRPAHSFDISEFALRSGARVTHAEVKAGFGVIDDYYAVPTPPQLVHGIVPIRDVMDVSEHVIDGVLRWNSPAGTDWVIMRLGASLTGQTNGPAPADVTGLEVDKLDGARVAGYLNRYLQHFREHVEAAADPARRISALLSDSIEAGSQNWTDSILEQFTRLRGYDARPWLPALAGYVVSSPEDSDKFLFDYRRTIADLYASEYYGALASEAHRRGMTYYAEALEDGRPQLGDDLTMRSHADVPMGAMWTFDPAAGPRATYVADLKGASSVAHVYGKAWTGSEAFTSFARPWASTPQTLKHVADLQLSLGVTRFCIHTSPHQPLAVPLPGIALAPSLGQAFTVNETWSGVARPWIDYLARCSAMLNAGRPAVDVAIFIGEEAPVTALLDPSGAVPAGFDFDYVGADALRDVLRVENGDIVSDGSSYRLLYLGGSSRRMTVATLHQLERLLDNGATLVGLRPSGSPSLIDSSDAFDDACERIWSGARTAGRVVATSNLDRAMSELGIRPFLDVEGATLRQISREVEGKRVTFLANPGAEPVSARLLTSAHGLTAWDPVRVRSEPLSADPLPSGDGRRSFTISLPPFSSLFVLTAPPAPHPIMHEERYVLDGSWTLSLPGTSIDSTMSPQPRLWTDASSSARTFSGTGTYRLDFQFGPERRNAQRFLLDLGGVRDIARVVLNGRDCGVAWTAPYEVDVSGALRQGTNRLEVEITNPWRNRLIAEAGNASGDIFEPMTSVFHSDAVPLPAGLSGPVTLITHTSTALSKEHQ